MEFDKKIDKLPEEVRNIVLSFDEDNDPYHECQRIDSELQKHGYTVDWGLDGVLYDIKKK